MLELNNNNNNNNYKITEIQNQKNNIKRYSIFLDNTFAFGIDEVDLLYHKLEVGKVLSQQEYNFIINNLVLTKAKNKALKYLSYKMRAKSQVIKKLQEEEFSEDIIKKVIIFLEKYNYINDENFCRAYINDKINLKGYGSYKISYELKALQIEDALIQKFLYDLDFINEEEKIKSLLLKKIEKNKYFNSSYDSSYNSNIYYKEKQKLFNYLARRGFSYDNINSTFTQLLEDLADEQY